MRQLSCGHRDMRVANYTEDYRWVVRCEVCETQETWTRQEWRERLLLDESGEGPPLSVAPELVLAGS